MYQDPLSKAAPWRSAIAGRMSALHAAQAENHLDLVVHSLAPVILWQYLHRSLFCLEDD